VIEQWDLFGEPEAVGRKLCWPEKAPAPQERIVRMLRVYGRCEGRICGECALLISRGRSRNFYKCTKSRVSHSEATDWRFRWPACGLFRER